MEMSKAKYMTINFDCPARFNFELSDNEHDLICEEHQTYIPDWVTCATSDSELRIKIDMDTGQILNWIKPDDRMVNKTIEDCTHY